MPADSDRVIATHQPSKVNGLARTPADENGLAAVRFHGMVSGTMPNAPSLCNEFFDDTQSQAFVLFVQIIFQDASDIRDITKWPGPRSAESAFVRFRHVKGLGG